MAGSDKTCSISECVKSVMARGLCSMHYSRLVRKGSPTARLRGEVVNGCRICPKCRTDKPLDMFSGTGPCKECRAAHAKAKRDASPEVRAARMDYARRYNAAHSDVLRQQAAEWRRANRDLVRKRSSARRAALKGAKVEDFLPVEVFERDDWTCRICELPIDRDAIWPHPLSVSLDHVIPLSRGGEHSRDNTACAHLRCNQRKYNALTKGA